VRAGQRQAAGGAGLYDCLPLVYPVHSYVPPPYYVCCPGVEALPVKSPAGKVQATTASAANVPVVKPTAIRVPGVKAPGVRAPRQDNKPIVLRVPSCVVRPRLYSRASPRRVPPSTPARAPQEQEQESSFRALPSSLPPFPSYPSIPFSFLSLSLSFSPSPFDSHTRSLLGPNLGFGSLDETIRFTWVREPSSSSGTCA